MFYNFLDYKLSVFRIPVDVRKAFDTIHHGILLAKDVYMGVSGIALQWITSNL